jgi:hypothetical protein
VANINVSPATVCEGGTLTFTANSDDNPDGTAYTWSGADGTVSGTGNATYTVGGIAGQKTVSLSASYTASGITCSSTHTDSKSGMIAGTPTISAVSSTTICAGNTADLEAIPGGGITTAMTYTWTIGSMQTTTDVATKTTQTLNEDTAFTLTVTNEHGCTSDEKAGTITVYPRPVVYQVTASTLCHSGATSLTASFSTSSGTTTAMTYTWTIGSAPSTTTYVPTVTSQTLSENTPFTLTVTNEYGCEDTYTGTINVRTDCVAFTLCPGITALSSKKSDGNVLSADAIGTCRSKGSGWRLPNNTEINCICTNKSEIPLGYNSAYFWTSETSEGKRYRKTFNTCAAPVLASTTVYSYVRCVF